MKQIASVTKDGVVRFRTEDATLTASVFRTFLERCLRSTTGKVVLSVEQLRAHGTPAVLDGLADQPQPIELYSLPRYAPARNATAYLHNDRKGPVNAAGLPDNKGQLRARRRQFMRKWQQLPQQVRNYFKHPGMLYAMVS
jgi:hypothetical protein